MKQETKDKISLSKKGKPCASPETAFKKGFTPWNKGKTLSAEHIENLKKSHLGQEAWNKGTVGKMNVLKGEKSHFWKGGISCLPYSVDWTRTLRRSIRERDNYTCQICGEEQGDITHHIHHIDYDKENCNPNNLITLCKSCHMKTNHNREYWTKFINNTKEQLLEFLAKSQEA